MKAKLLIEGKEIEVEISEKEYKKLYPPEEKKTGYERVPSNNRYFYVAADGSLESDLDEYNCIENDYYKSANYYSSEIMVENNARADKLMRQLRRFAVEHRESKADLNSIYTDKHYIRYDYDDNDLGTNYTSYTKVFGAIYFDSREAAQAAIDEFHDELMWYFTEYKDSL